MSNSQNATTRRAARKNISPRIAALGLAAAALGAPAAARADTVNLNFTGYGNGRMVHASMGSQSMDVFAGRLLHHASGGTAGMAGMSNIVTFCVDLFQQQATTPSQYTSSNVAGLSGNTGLTNLGYGKQSAIYDIYQAAAGREFTLGLDYACAFQLAIWEVVYNYDPNQPNHGLSITSGSFHATGPGGVPLSASIMDKVNFLLGSVGMGAGAHGVMGLRSGPFQDQLFDQAVVPLPSARWLGVFGLGLVGFAKRRRWRG